MAKVREERDEAVKRLEHQESAIRERVARALSQLYYSGYLTNPQASYEVLDAIRDAREDS
jgi:2-phospho-L-lactate transferase/gluconeogenesis factor (CofD/UPF0052 family)